MIRHFLCSTLVVGALTQVALAQAEPPPRRGPGIPDPSVVPVRAIVLKVEGKRLIVGPGSRGGMKEGMVLRVFRGVRPYASNQWVGRARAVQVAEQEATLELTEGEARPTDFVLSDPVPLPREVTLPKADRIQRPSPPRPSQRSLTVRLLALAEKPGREVVSFGVPFPPGALQSDNEITVWSGDVELAVASKVLAPWRLDGKQGSPRSVLVQFELDFTGKTEQTVTLRWDRPRTRHRRALTPIADTLLPHSVELTVSRRPYTTAYEEPRVLAILPPKWLCESWVAGPQVPAEENRWVPEFDAFQMRVYKGTDQRAGQAGANFSADFADHQLDRTVALYRLYLRTGDAEVARHAYQHATFYRNNICSAERSKRGRGCFLLKHPNPEQGWLDVKYAYPEGLAVHYLLTGDERFTSTIEDLCAFWDSEFGRSVRNDYTKRPAFWTERHCAFAWLAGLHAYQLTGNPKYLEDAKQQCDNVFHMQTAPPDGHPPDGSWRHSSGHHGEGGNDLGSSVWMSALLVDAIFQHWLLTGEARCPNMVSAYAEYVERYGLRWYAWDTTRPNWAMPYYFASSLQGGYTDSGAESDHNIETGYLMLMGHYFRPDPRYLFWGYYLLTTQNARMHPRMFNWCYRASPQAIWFLREAGVDPEELEALTLPERLASTRNTPAQGG